MIEPGVCRRRRAQRAGSGGRLGAGGGTALGLLVGLAIGALIAAAFAWWFTRTPPFTTAPTRDTGQAASASSGAVSDMKFDFYKTLTGETNGTTKEPATIVPEPPRVAAIAPEPPPAQTQERLFWQVGAFANEREASRVRAELALVGITSTVEPVRMPDGRTLYRVRAGPYRSQDEAQVARARLQAAGYSPTLVR
ncbi:MAG: SPOR domain-containing protein [Tepidiphilus sp.]|uniref:SPOR domain-containing protein n=1 Tax=Tepidiphilus baoligensis TaxID=2698687 RepID=A0ABX1QKJ2_9PROT|nr:SPOR domain-containing protein [Tepidiphilus baoligensis]MDD2408252.1 SPOR domain-containing protein [Tepidiphilus sp.]MDD3433637.1 SPOR domain-containing protein [Tepidiphilus sp.]NMH16446.1 hypothetical protein [Tepidiphilus baoligensis]